MTGSQKAIKVVSIIVIIVSILSILAGCFTSGQLDGTSIVSAIVQLALMALCVYLANNVRKLRA